MPGTPGVSDLAQLDTLAEEFGVSVAHREPIEPASRSWTPLQGRSPAHRRGRRSGRVDAARACSRPTAFDVVKDRLLLVRASDRSALGAKGRPVALGEGVGALGDFFLAAYRSRRQAAVDRRRVRGATEADMLKNLTAFERVMWPAMAERVRVHARRRRPARSAGRDRLDAEMRQADRRGRAAPGHRQAAQAAQAARRPTSRCIPGTAPSRTATGCWS